MMRLNALGAAVMLTACASGPQPQSTVAAHTRAPVNYENTVSSYFDLTIPGPQAGRKLSFGAPESSHCPFLGSGGAHLGWVVPVVYDTTPPASGKSGASASGKAVASATATPAVKTGNAVSISSADPGGTVSLADVSVTGTRYFFWFSSDTLSAVTRRVDLCP
jgi:hypothetical protein